MTDPPVPPSPEDVAPPPAQRWTPRSAIRRAVVVLRSEGARSLGFKLLGETVYRRVVVLGRSLAGPLLRFDPPPGVEIDRLRPAEIDRYLALRPAADGREIERRLAAGDRCLVARLDGRIVHAGWLASRPVWSDYLGMDVAPRPGEAYVYESFTDPAHRRSGITAARSTVALRLARDEGHRSIIGIVMPENRAAFGPARKMGFAPCGVIGWVGVGRWRYEFDRRRPVA